MTGQPHYPYADGDRAVLGPEVTATADGMTICWQGANYRRDHGQAEQAAASKDLSPLRPYEKQQGGYWLYPPGCDVHGNGRVWVTADQHDHRLEAVRKLRDDMLGSSDTRWFADQLTGVLDDTPTVPATTQATDGPACRYCGADCSNGRSWDGGNLYACGPCAGDRAAVSRAGGDFDALVQRVRGRHVADEHAEQPEPATVTDPEYLRKQYTAIISALHDTRPDAVAAELLRVRDRHLQQLRQRLRLAAREQADYEEHVVGELNETNIELAQRAGRAETALGRIRDLHREEYGSCAECTHESGVPFPCPTIRALDGPA